MLREEPHKAVILGGGRGGVAMLELFLEESLVTVVAMADTNADAPGMKLARQHGIPTYADAEMALRSNAPCIAFNLTHDERVETAAADILGAGYVIGGLEANLIWNMVTNLKQAKEELRFHAMHDALTGLYNRRYMSDHLRLAATQALRYKLALSVVLIDIDHFKEVNDSYGHATGDMVLKSIASLLRHGLRDADILGRWGGEEFLVVLPHTGEAGARTAAEYCLQRVREVPMDMGHGVKRTITFSAGIASFDSTAEGASAAEAVDSLLAEADARLYTAKARGRAQVVGEENALFS